MQAKDICIRATESMGRETVLHDRMANREYAHERSARVEVLSICHYRLRSRVSETREQITNAFRKLEIARLQVALL